MLFDWLTVGQVIAVSPASPARGPKYSVKKSKTAVLSAEEARQLLDSIDPSSHVGLRDRALIALIVYTFARIGAALQMRVEDVYTEKQRTWVRLHEKGGKRHEMPCHRNLDSYLQTYIDAAGIGGNPKNTLFPTTMGHTGLLSNRAMTQADDYRMIRRRAVDAGIKAKIGNHSSRATGILEYLRNGSRREIAQQTANHESARDNPRRWNVTNAPATPLRPSPGRDGLL